MTKPVDQNKVFPIRGHHLLCLQGFQGYGYSSGFVENFWGVLAALQNDDTLDFKVTKDCDVFCEACPHRQGEICGKDETAQTRMQGLDGLTLKRLNLSPGHVQNAKSLLAHVNATLKTTRDVDGICSACQWKEKCLWYQKLTPA